MQQAHLASPHGVVQLVLAAWDGVCVGACVCGSVGVFLCLCLCLFVHLCCWVMMLQPGLHGQWRFYAFFFKCLKVEVRGLPCHVRASPSDTADVRVPCLVCLALQALWAC